MEWPDRRIWPLFISVFGYRKSYNDSSFLNILNYYLPLTCRRQEKWCHFRSVNMCVRHSSFTCMCRTYCGHVYQFRYIFTQEEIMTCVDFKRKRPMSKFTNNTYGIELMNTVLYGGWFVPFRLFVISRRHNEGAITKRRKDESEKTKRRKRKDEMTKAKRR